MKLIQKREAGGNHWQRRVREKGWVIHRTKDLHQAIRMTLKIVSRYLHTSTVATWVVFRKNSSHHNCCGLNGPHFFFFYHVLQMRKLRQDQLHSSHKWKRWALVKKFLGVSRRRQQSIKQIRSSLWGQGPMWL